MDSLFSSLPHWACHSVPKASGTIWPGWDRPPRPPAEHGHLILPCNAFFGMHLRATRCAGADGEAWGCKLGQGRGKEGRRQKGGGEEGGFLAEGVGEAPCPPPWHMHTPTCTHSHPLANFTHPNTHAPQFTDIHTPRDTHTPSHGCASVVGTHWHTQTRALTRPASPILISISIS